jgi:hypothetical protein
MRREVTSGLLVVAAGATFWAYTIASSLIREFSANTTFTDLAVLFLLGFIAGSSLGLALWLNRRKTL